MLEKLQKIGLTEKESHIYLALAKLGEASANELAKQTGSNRTVTYNVLQQLIHKGIVTYIKKAGKRAYLVANPKSLLAPIRENEKIALDLVSELDKIRKTGLISNRVEIYEGLEGMKSIFEEIRKTKDLRVINATGLIFEHLKFGAKHIVKDMVRHKGLKVIANRSMKKTPLVQFKMKVKYLPKEAENYATTFIFENKVIIQVLKDKPFLIKIESNDIYDGFRKDFDVLWGRL